MKIRNILFLATIYFFCMIGAHADSNKDAIEIFRNTRCITCGGQSIEESNSVFAQNLKSKIQKKLRDGVSKQGVYRDLRKEYGEGVFFTSPDDNRGLVVSAAFVFISFVLFFVYLSR